MIQTENLKNIKNYRLVTSDLIKPGTVEYVFFFNFWYFPPTSMSGVKFSENVISAQNNFKKSI